MKEEEFFLRQEVLMERGASVLGELFRMRRTHGESIPADPASILYELIWNAKQDILLTKTQPELDRIEGQFMLVERFIAKTDFTG